MSIFKKIWTAVRGGANETGEAIVDSQALRILDQEIRDAARELDKAKASLTTVMAQKMAVERKVNELKNSVEEHEGYAIKALDGGQESLALEIAEKIASLSNDLQPQEAVLESHTGSVNQLKKAIKQTTSRLDAMKREVAIIKSTESVQKAQAALKSRMAGSSSSMTSATESIKRIKQRQQERNDRMNAALELEKEQSGGDLSAKMREAGIIGNSSSGNSVLEKLKSRQAGTGD